MDNTPTISDCTAVAEYLAKFGVDIQFSPVKEMTNPATDMMSFKYNVTFKTHKGHGKKMRGYMYGTYSQYIKHVTVSAWEIVNAIFSFARLGFVSSHKSFCAQGGIPQDKNSLTVYNRAKRYWNRLVDIGLTRIDIAEIINHSYNAQLKG